MKKVIVFICLLCCILLNSCRIDSFFNQFTPEEVDSSKPWILYLVNSPDIKHDETVDSFTYKVLSAGFEDFELIDEKSTETYPKKIGFDISILNANPTEQTIDIKLAFTCLQDQKDFLILGAYKILAMDGQNYTKPQNNLLTIPSQSTVKIGLSFNIEGYNQFIDLKFVDLLFETPNNKTITFKRFEKKPT